MHRAMDRGATWTGVVSDGVTAAEDGRFFMPMESSQVWLWCTWSGNLAYNGFSKLLGTVFDILLKISS